MAKKPTEKPGKKSGTSTATTSPRSRVTEKKKRFSEAVVGQLVEGKKINATAAARVAYPDSNNPKEMGHKLRYDPAVQNEIMEMLDLAGMTKPALIMKLKNFVFDSDDENIQAKMWPEAAKLHNLYPKEGDLHLHEHKHVTLTERLLKEVDEGKVD